MEEHTNGNTTKGATTEGRPTRVIVRGKPGVKFKWTDYEAPQPQEIDAVAGQYQFHPLTVEDVKTFNQRAKVMAYDDYLFLSLHILESVNDEIEDRELEVFLGTDYLISFHREPLTLLERAKKRFEADALGNKLGPDYLLYVIVDEIVDAIFPILETLDDEIDRLEDETLTNATTGTLHEIFKYKQALIKMRRIVAPMRDVMNALAGTRFGLIDKQTALYFRDAYDLLSRIYELIETERDLLSSSLDTYLSVVSNRLNETMKKLTIIATIFLPISFIVGFGGMNFRYLPFDNAMVFWMIMASLVIVPAVMLLYFRRKGWL